MVSGINKILVLVLILAWRLAPAGEQVPSMLVMGDSLSAGYGITQQESWVALLRDRLQAQGYGYAVVNASISGDTTTGGLRRLPRALVKHRPAIVIIELGGNDGLRGTPIATIRANLARMIELSRQAGARVILAGMQIPTNYGAGYTRAFAAIYPELATHYRVALIGFMLDGIALDRSQVQADGIHPTAKAQPRLLDNVWRALEPELKPAAKTASAQATTGTTSRATAKAEAAVAGR